MKRPLPFVSIVVCCYNGATKLPVCLNALQKQDYKGRLEIIVVDDGSADDTYAVAAGFKDVTVIKNAQNQGLAGSRNVGVRAAQGSIVAFTDDDCRPDTNWISALVSGYTDEDVMGVGGEVQSKDRQTLTLRYLQHSKPLKPLENTLAKSGKLLYRFGLYAKNLIGQERLPLQSARRVYALVGANMSFRKKALEEIGMFDARFRFGAEEEDVCKRLNERYPDGLQFVPGAIVGHQFEPNLRDTLRRSRAYGRGNARMVRKHSGMHPVVYPFPILIALLPLLALLHPIWLVLPLCAPLGIYLKWVRLAVSQRMPEALLYPYIQYLQETYNNVGVLKGLWEYRSTFKVEPSPASSSTARRPYGTVLLPAVGLLLVLIAGQVFQAGWMNFLGAIGLLLLPGHLIIRALKTPVTQPMGYAALSMVSGLAWTMALGFLSVLFLPLIGVDKPLAALPVSLMYSAGIAVLALAALRHKRPPIHLKMPQPNLSTAALYTGAAALPLLSFIGTNLLNGGGSNIVSILMFVLAAGLIAGVFAAGKKVSRSVWPVLLFSISVSALWSYSLRSNYLFGWDIQQEYDVFLATQKAGDWAVGQAHTPYDAMLSLTVLPVILSNVAKVGGLILFKVLYPLIFSMLPVVLYYAYGLFVKQWLAFSAALLTIAQFYYMQQFSALARQQVAFLCFGTVVYLAIDKRWDGRAKEWLIGLVAFGLITSHYSTTYMTVALMALIFVGARLALMLRNRSFRIKQNDPAYVRLWLIAGLIAGSCLWYGPITRSSRAMQTAADVRSVADLQSALDRSEKGETSQPKTTAQYLAGVGESYRRDKAYFSYYDNASNAGLRQLEPQGIAKRRVWYPLSQAIETGLRYGWWLSGLAAGAVIGLNGWRQRKLSQLEMGLFAAVPAALFVIGHLWPGLDQLYNITRLNQQLLLFTALPAVMGVQWLLRKGSERVQKAVIASALITGFLLASGVVTQLAGGSPTANLNNFGSDYQRFYVHPTDVQAALWLGSRRDGRRPVYADRYASLRLTIPTNVNRGLMHDITPETLAQGAYVYADRTNVTDGITVASKGQGMTFAFPAEFLQQNKNILYSNGSAEIYR